MSIQNIPVLFDQSLIVGQSLIKKLMKILNTTIFNYEIFYNNHCQKETSAT